MGNLSALANNVVQTTPVGVIEAFAGVNAPAGWLFCDGSAVSRIQYPELFSALGTTYGSGDGSTTFNLPDLRGRMPFGKGTHSDVATLGQNEGASLANRRPKHQHTVYDPGHNHGTNSRYQANPWNNGAGVAATDGAGSYINGPTTTSTTNFKVNPEGASSSTSPQDAPPYLVVNYIIKAVADLPRGGWFYQNQPPVVTQLPSNPQIGEEVYLLVSGNLFQKRYDGTQWQDVGQETLNTARLSGVVAHGNLPDGTPTWFATARAAFPSGSSQAATVSINVPYKSSVLVTASASAYVSGVGLYRTYTAVYGITGWVEGSFFFYNQTFVHHTTPTAAQLLTLNPQAYTFGCLQNGTTDANDQATFMIYGTRVS